MKSWMSGMLLITINERQDLKRETWEEDRGLNMGLKGARGLKIGQCQGVRGCW